MLYQTVQAVQIREVGQLSFENHSQLVLAFLEFFIRDGEDDSFSQGIDALQFNKSAIERSLFAHRLTAMPKEKISDGF